MIATHEPTFWSDADLLHLVKDDPLYKSKMDFASRNKIAVWRCHDHAHSHKPDLIWHDWNESLGWAYYQSSSDRGWLLPETTLQELAQYVARTLPAGTRSIRIVGDPKLPVRKVISGRDLIRMGADVDCVICSGSLCSHRRSQRSRVPSLAEVRCAEPLLRRVKQRRRAQQIGPA